MPRKKKVAEEESVTKEPKIENESVVPEPFSPKCWYCKRDTTEFRCAKGDSNQYRFCSIECYNADRTL